MTQKQKNASSVEHADMDDGMELDDASKGLFELAQGDGDNHGALPTFDELATRRFVNTAIEAAASTPARSDNRILNLNHRWMGIAAAAAVVLLSASIFLWHLSTDAEVLLPPTESTAIGTNTGAFALVSGALLLDQKSIKVDEKVPLNTPFHVDRENSIFVMDNGIAVAAAEGTELSIIDDGSSQLTVNLISGRIFVALDPALPRGPFHVATSAGTVVALGTVFTVQASPDDAVVHLHRGKVAVLRGGFSKHILVGGQRLILGTDTPTAISESETSEMKDIARSITEVGFGDHLKPLIRASDVASPSERPSADGTASQDQESIRSPKTAIHSPQLSLKALMKQARKAKLDGDWAKAAKTYQEAAKRFPNSGDAGTALVSLGQLYLNRLGQPQKALGYYGKYLRGKKHGPLFEEAMYGKSRCYRALGNQDAERKVLTALLSRYPDGLHAGIATQRMNQLKN